MKIFEIIESSGNMHGREIDWEQEIRDDIMLRGGQIHPYYQGLGISQAAQKAKEYYNKGQTSQGKAVKNALVFFGFDPDKMPGNSNAIPKTATNTGPKKAYKLEPTNVPRSRGAQIGNQNAFKGGTASKNTGVLGTPQGFKQGIAHGMAKYKDADNTTGISRIRKSKYNK
jgi:hypothetical protein